MTKSNASLLSKLLDPSVLPRLPGAIKSKLNRFLHEKLVFRLVSKENVFTSIWRNNYWGSRESLSGPGSTLNYTQEIRQKLPSMFEEYDIGTVFDAPCGDMHWMRYVLKDANFVYLGGDIVGELVNANMNKFASAKINFMKFDMTADIFPAADVWLCRAVFYHLSNLDIYLALEQFAASNIKYILTTNHITNEEHINKDIKTGDWRLLNLTLPPFNFPRESLWEVNDYVAPHPAATLTLWTKMQIEAVLPALRKIYLQ
jgi:hypothetical protein